jgi:hypothetical protein
MTVKNNSHISYWYLANIIPIECSRYYTQQNNIIKKIYKKIVYQPLQICFCSSIDVSNTRSHLGQKCFRGGLKCVLKCDNV